MKKIWDWIAKRWNICLLKKQAVAEPSEPSEPWRYPARNCFCHMHPFVWCPVHDGGEKAECGPQNTTQGIEMKNRKGLTLVELLVAIAILGIIVALVAGTVGNFNGREFEAEVTEKWSDIDYEGEKIYRVRTISPTGEIDTWNSYFCHDDIQVGVSYQFKSHGGYLKSANRLAIQPTKPTNAEIDYGGK